MITDKSNAVINSAIIVTLAKQALDNLPCRKTQQQIGIGASLHQFRKEFGTVKIALPRQSGHSIAALQLLYEYPGSLAFVPNDNSRDHMRLQLRRFTDDYDVYDRIDKSIMIPAHQSLIQIRPVEKRPFIIFDQFSQMQKEMIERVTDSLHANIIVELQ